MADQYENIKFEYQNLTLKDDYYYMFDHNVDILMSVVDDGSPAFSYPLDSHLTYEVVSSEFDGTNFWTMENSGDNVYIKRWFIDGYICKLQDTFNLIAGSGHKYSSKAFTVENYQATISGVVTVGSTNIPMTEGYSTKLSSGMAVTLGPNSVRQTETINVQDAGEGWVTIQDPTEYAYMPDDNISFYADIWLFNEYDGEDTTGALYKFNGYSGAYILKYPGGEYKGVTACTFTTTDSFVEYGEIHSLVFIKGVNLLFFNPVPVGMDFSIYRSMVLKNFDYDDSEIITVFDLCIVNENIYKLQSEAFIKQTVSAFTHGYSYQVEPFQNMITSVLVSSNPGVLPADGITTTNISATVKDQYGNPVAGRLVTFSLGAESDVGGSIIGNNPAGTNAEGVAITIYKADSSPGFVQIVANVYQA